ncbi:MAG: N-acetyl-D-Glu racemase DgcA [Pseudomonadota bacterium]
MLSLTVTSVSRPLVAPFKISRGVKTHAETIVATLSDGRHIGRGESVPYARYGESLESVIAQIQDVETDIGQGLDRIALQDRLSAGAARCALDCAFWDLEAKRTGQSVVTLADLPTPKPLTTAMTISLAAPDAMATAASKAEGNLLKLKLGNGDLDLQRLDAVHQARPDARLILDGNEGLSEDAYGAIIERAAACGVVLIEQPFAAGRDGALHRMSASTVAICADESVHTRADLPALAKLYDAVNIKLDKTGGLTEALAMVREARRFGLGVMVGCMVAGSLSMAPAVLLGQLADFVDLDGPLWLAEDVDFGLTYQHGTLGPPSRQLWG